MRFRKIKLATISFMSFCLSSYPYTTSRLQMVGFSWNLVFEYFFERSVEKIQVSLQSDKNNWHFTWRL